MRPQNFQVQYGRDEIQTCVAELAAGISDWAEEVWHESHTDLLTIPVLNGGMFFFTDLVRGISRSVEIAPASSCAYDPESNSLKQQSVDLNIQSVPAQGRSVLLVDDICDSGKTLPALKQALLDKGALTVRTAVLLKRELGHETFEPDWVGFRYQGPEWFVGYGMDDSNRWRNLPEICVILQSTD